MLEFRQTVQCLIYFNGKYFFIKGKDTGFSSSMGMGIVWGFPEVFLWVWGLKSNHHVSSGF